MLFSGEETLAALFPYVMGETGPCTTFLPELVLRWQEEREGQVRAEQGKQAWVVARARLF